MDAHEDRARDALLLVNLGTPGAPTATAVRDYLLEFLSDPRVVALPRWLWLPLLRGVVLPRRAPRVAEKYASIWLPDGSPLAVHTRDLAAAVRQRLPAMRLPRMVDALVDCMDRARPALQQSREDHRLEQQVKGRDADLLEQVIRGERCALHLRVEGNHRDEE